MYNSIYPGYVNINPVINKRQITRKQDEEKTPHSSQNAENATQQEKHSSNNNSYFPTGEKVAIDYTKRQIAIDQVLVDFKNTVNAIGSPDNIKAEVESYLSLVEGQAKKDNPNAQIIQSNLKNASQILDQYITETLKKPSKVVENWVDALFLQKIDYKSANVEQPSPQPSPTGEGIKEFEQPSFQPAPNVNGTNEIVEEQQASTITQAPQLNSQSQVYVPSDPQLKRMFIQAKKYSAINEKEKALSAFKNTLDYANSIGDEQTIAMIHFEEGKLYDEFNQIEDALYNFNQAAKQSNDNNIKAKAHLSMGKIYDDFVKFEPAVNHLAAAVSYAGQADNLNVQTQALSDLAQIHTSRYDKNNAFMFMDMASIVAEETKNNKTKGITLSKNAKMCEKLGDKSKALNLFSSSASSFHQINDSENLAKNYASAADVMIQYGNYTKAKKLLSKAYSAAQKTANVELRKQISQAYSSI